MILQDERNKKKLKIIMEEKKQTFEVRFSPRNFRSNFFFVSENIPTIQFYLLEEKMVNRLGVSSLNVTVGSKTHKKIF